MKLLLTAAGISNPSIHNALVDLLGKPIAEANALFIPTAIYAEFNASIYIINWGKIYMHSSMSVEHRTFKNKLFSSPYYY